MMVSTIIAALCMIALIEKQLMENAEMPTVPTA